LKKWQRIFTAEDRVLARRAGFGRRRAFGKKPALLVIDVNRSFVGSSPRSASKSIEEYRTACGTQAWHALKCIRALVQRCRDKYVPIIYTTNDPLVTKHSGGPDKVWRSEEIWDEKSQTLVSEIQPSPEDLVLRKTKASAFFATPLVAILMARGVDSLLVVGGSTSGCVRATVVDAMSYNFRVFVVEEGTFDRFELSHLVALWDMHMKYADVVTRAKVMKYLSSL